MSDSSKLKRAFRLGVALTGSLDFKSVASVGISTDGGIFVAPVQVKDYGWHYGQTSNSAAGQQVDTQLRPKLHYHRSGIAGITLTSAGLERRTLQLTPLDQIQRGQIFSIVCVRPGELNTSASGNALRKRDIFTLADRWPQVISWTLSVVSHGGNELESADIESLAQPVGLLRGDPTRFIVGLSAYQRRATLVGHVELSFSGSRREEPGISVVAVPWKADGPRFVELALGLWTAPMRNPIIRYENEAGVPK